MIDSKEKPFYLNEGDAEWANQTDQKMTLEEKIRDTKL